VIAVFFIAMFPHPFPIIIILWPLEVTLNHFVGIKLMMESKINDSHSDLFGHNLQMESLKVFLMVAAL